MSYILDALQRAEAERARGGVPTLQTRPLSDSATTPALVTTQRLRLAVVALVAILIATALAWWLWGSAPSPGAVASKTADVLPVSAAPAPITPATPAVPAPVVSVAPAAPAAPTPTVMPVQPPRVVAPAAPSAAPSAAMPVAPPRQLTALPQAAATSPPKQQATPPIAAPAPPPTLAPLLSALPEDIRRQIPTLSISGTVYSADPAQRLLLVNGQVLNEGSQVAPDLSLVEIRSNSAEFNFQGTRFRIAR